MTLLLGLPVCAADTESWNGLEFELVNNARWMVRARGESRSTDAFRDLLNVRGVADVRFSAAPKFTLVSRFDFVEGRTRIGWEDVSRLGTGFEVPVRGEFRTFTARTVVEHSWLPEGRSYNRLRQRFSLRWTQVKLKPQLMAELMADAQGWAASRPSFTVLVPMGKRVDLDVGYHFEWRPGRLGGNRQMIYTYLRVLRQNR